VGAAIVEIDPNQIGVPNVVLPQAAHPAGLPDGSQLGGPGGQRRM